MAAPLDVERVELAGRPVPLIEGVGTFSLASNGTLVYVPAVPELATRVVRVSRDGSSEETFPLPESYFIDPRLSPGGNQLSLTDLKDGLNRDVYVLDIESAVLRQLTFGEGGFSVWSPDGTRLVFQSRVAGFTTLYSKPVDGSAEATPLVRSDEVQMPHAWSAASGLLFHRAAKEGSHDLWRLPPGDDEARSLLVTDAYELGASFSPDGDWFAYASDESGRVEIYVRQVDGVAGGKHRISTDGGNEPVWSRDGSEIFYRHSDRMMAVPVELGEGFTYGEPKELFRGPYLSIVAPFAQYDVSADGRFFFMVRPAQEPPGEVRVVLNWVEELERLVPVD